MPWGAWRTRARRSILKLKAGLNEGGLLLGGPNPPFRQRPLRTSARRSMVLLGFSSAPSQYAASFLSGNAA
jgi:hypothetical protein